MYLEGPWKRLRKPACLERQAADNFVVTFDKKFSRDQFIKQLWHTLTTVAFRLQRKSLLLSSYGVLDVKPWYYRAS